uniref:Uncharacterized protein n=1 Tax=Arundo donax TaxID=35708 RepID=A0A0A8Z0B8_ARUDO
MWWMQNLAKPSTKRLSRILLPLVSSTFKMANTPSMGQATDYKQAQAKELPVATFLHRKVDRRMIRSLHRRVLQSL